MKTPSFICCHAIAALLLGLTVACTEKSIENTLRAPAYPLVTIDPYTSVWSAADNLYDVMPTHWTGRAKPLYGTIDVDGTEYRFLGGNSPVTYMVGGSAMDDSYSVRYVTTCPEKRWADPDFDDSKWLEGRGAIGDISNRPNVKTDWKGGSIWIRRNIHLRENEMEGDFFLRHRDREDAEYYINGHQVLVSPFASNSDVMEALDDSSKSLLHPGDNVIAVKCTNKAYYKALVDFGLYRSSVERVPCSTAAKQILADVQATQTHYAFDCGPVRLEVDFSAPLYDLCNLELISRPINYISYSVKSMDGKKHNVSVRITPSPFWASNYPSMDIVEEEFDHNDMHFYRTGTASQNVFGRKGDRLCIDWGYFYFAEPHTNTGAKGHYLIGYDDIYAIQYFGENLRPYWNRYSDRTILDEFDAAEADYEKIMRSCKKFDRRLFSETLSKGGRKYAELCALAYRQTIAAHKLVLLPGGEPGLFSKENDSNGCIGTVDITYPSAPLFLKYNPDLVLALMNHIYEYTESGRRTKPFPAHDVGTYPLANGEIYGADMPVEESGNMIILTAAACKAKGDYSYASKHWETLSTWVKYLIEYGTDPAEQLCTDDFAGHLSRNANLSIKAIMGIACYGMMAGELGDKAVQEEYMAKAREAAARWMSLADVGNHYGLTFDSGPDTWSQKYNLVWDRILNLNIFPTEVVRKEISYYLTQMNRYGLPLDSRKNYTKSDWIMWSATMAEKQEDFEALLGPMWDFYNTTTSRVPMTDWYNTDDPTYVHFIARSVVGGYFIKML